MPAPHYYPRTHVHASEAGEDALIITMKMTVPTEVFDKSLDLAAFQHRVWLLFSDQMSLPTREAIDEASAYLWRAIFARQITSSSPEPPGE